MKRFSLKNAVLATTTFLVITSCESTTKEDTPSDLDTNSTPTSDTLISIEEEEVSYLFDTISFNITEAEKEKITKLYATQDPGDFTFVDPNELATAEEQHQYLIDQESYLWNKLAFYEREKFVSLDRMIEEIELNQNATSEVIDSIKLYTKKLKSLYLDREAISDPSKIIYDEMNVDIINKIYSLADGIENMEGFQTYNYMKEVVDSLDNSVILSYRLAHPDAIHAYNSFVTRFESELTEKGLSTELIKEWAVE